MQLESPAKMGMTWNDLEMVRMAQLRMFLHSWRLRLPWMEKSHLLEAPIAWQASLKNEHLRWLGVYHLHNVNHDR